VSWNGSALLDSTNVVAAEWTNLEFVVSATGPSTVLEFGFEDDYDNFGLDDVSVLPLQPGIGSVRLTGSNLVFNVSNGQSGSTYYVLVSTNLALPMDQWTRVATNVLAASGNFTITATNTVTRSLSHRFYRLEMQ
jgi:hypothetical protein